MPHSWAQRIERQRATSISFWEGKLGMSQLVWYYRFCKGLHIFSGVD